MLSSVEERARTRKFQGFPLSILLIDLPKVVAIQVQERCSYSAIIISFFQKMKGWTKKRSKKRTEIRFLLELVFRKKVGLGGFLAKQSEDLMHVRLIFKLGSSTFHEKRKKKSLWNP